MCNAFSPRRAKGTKFHEEEGRRPRWPGYPPLSRLGGNHWGGRGVGGGRRSSWRPRQRGRWGDAGMRGHGDGEMGRWGDATRGARYVHVVARGKCLGVLWLRGKCIISGEEMMQSVASVSAGLQSGGLGRMDGRRPVAGRNGVRFMRFSKSSAGNPRGWVL